MTMLDPLESRQQQQQQLVAKAALALLCMAIGEQGRAESHGLGSMGHFYCSAFERRRSFDCLLHIHTHSRTPIEGLQAREPWQASTNRPTDESDDDKRGANMHNLSAKKVRAR